MLNLFEICLFQRKYMFAPPLGDYLPTILTFYKHFCLDALSYFLRQCHVFLNKLPHEWNNFKRISYQHVLSGQILQNWITYWIIKSQTCLSYFKHVFMIYIYMSYVINMLSYCVYTINKHISRKHILTDQIVVPEMQNVYIKKRELNLCQYFIFKICHP